MHMDETKTKLGMPDQKQVEKLNRLVSSKSL